MVLALSARVLLLATFTGGFVAIFLIFHCCITLICIHFFLCVLSLNGQVTFVPIRNQLLSIGSRGEENLLSVRQ